MNLVTAMLILAADASGTGKSPDKGPGVLLIVGIALAIAVVFALGAAAIIRRSRRTREPEGTHDRGDVGRI